MTRSLYFYLIEDAITLKLLFAFPKRLEHCANHQPRSWWNSPLRVCALCAQRPCWCFPSYVLIFFKNPLVFMHLISRNNKALVCLFASPPIWPASLQFETPSWALVHFLWVSSSPPLAEPALWTTVRNQTGSISFSKSLLSVFLALLWRSGFQMDDHSPQ